jgi:nitrogen fixation NifU-like protein
MSGGYSNIVLDHFEHPRNVGSLPNPDAFAHAENPASGATLALCLALDKGVIVRAMFQAQGCAATIASGSVLTELVVGKTPIQARELGRDDIENALGGLPPTRKHAADLAIDAVRGALSDLERR